MTNPRTAAEVEAKLKGIAANRKMTLDTMDKWKSELAKYEFKHKNREIQIARLKEKIAGGEQCLETLAALESELAGMKPEFKVGDRVTCTGVVKAVHVDSDGIPICDVVFDGDNGDVSTLYTTALSPEPSGNSGELPELNGDSIAPLYTALRNLHDECVDYAKINNLGITPATKRAKAALDGCLDMALSCYLCGALALIEDAEITGEVCSLAAEIVARTAPTSPDAEPVGLLGYANLYSNGAKGNIHKSVEEAKSFTQLGLPNMECVEMAVPVYRHPAPAVEGKEIGYVVERVTPNIEGVTPYGVLWQTLEEGQQALEYYRNGSQKGSVYRLTKVYAGAPPVPSAPVVAGQGVVERIRAAFESHKNATFGRAKEIAEAAFDAALAEVRVLPEASEWAKDAVSRMRYGRLRATESLTKEQNLDIAAAALLAATDTEVWK